MLLTPPQSRALYEHAVSNRYAILAVNADSPAAMVDCLLAAKECEAPVIIETSLWQLTGHSFGAGDPILGVDRYLATLRTLAESERFEDVPVIYHTDHIKGAGTVSILQHAMRENASSISLDSSEMTGDENVETLSSLCRFASENSLEATLEMEAGVDDGVTSLSETRSLFGRVEERHPGFLALWAPGVGTCHGLGSDPQAFSPQAVKDHQEFAAELAGRPVGIALHGSSGLDAERLSEAVAAGVAKVNWSSESLLIRSQAARAFYAENGSRLEKGDPDFKETAMDNGVQKAVSRIYVPRVVDRIRSLNGAGQRRSFLNELLSHA